MNYNSLKELTNNNPLHLYIGKGNPNSNILFIGKEAAIDQETNSEVYYRDIKNNHLQWIENIENKTIQDEIANWPPMYCSKDYNPIYPYKGQLNKIESRNENGEILRGKGGTNSTWYYYQKIVDSVFFNNLKSEYINFHEKAFLTELNDASAKYSKDVDKIARDESLELRQEFLTQKFYQKFPIVIVAAGHYIRNHKIDLEKTFNVKYDKLISIGKSNFINVHYDNIDNPKKIVIHTNQLSMGISNDLIHKISELIRNFISKPQIK